LFTHENFFSAGREEEWGRTNSFSYWLSAVLPTGHHTPFVAITQYPAPGSDEIAN
jgi:hypothetical protein